jgi:hypothetical protein
MEINFYNIRSTTKGRTDSFEELCCQLFFREHSSADNEYKRFRGDGGDGGVEALFIQADDSKVAMQSKYWENSKFDSSQIKQLTKSIDAAKCNHPELTTYYITIPFNFTGPVASGKRGKSQTEKFDAWKDEKEQEHSIEIVLWAESYLSEIILKRDATGGLRKYWFDSTILTDIQYKNHIEEAVAQAGKRYTPKLSVKVPLAEALDSFVRPTVIVAEIEQHLSDLDRKSQYSFQEVLKGDYGISCDTFEEIKRQLLLLCIPDQEFNTLQENLVKLITTTISKLSVIEPTLIDELGDDFQDTPGYRQFNAEYLCVFPAAKLDSTREVNSVLSLVLDWLQSVPVSLNYSQQMLIHGVAGIGKTHSMIDYIQSQNRLGLWIFFGEDFTDAEPWKIIADKLGLNSTLSRDELFEMLSTQAISQNQKAVIFIDALNETDNRKNWRKWLPVLAKQVSRYPSIKLCVSCRDTYLGDVFENREKWVEFTHNGFLGQEYMAIQEFFSFYELKPPVVPLLQSEFRNPLFLHIVCDSLKGAGYNEVPRGRLGFQDMLNICLNHKNQLLSKRCDCDPNIPVVEAALSAIALQMSEANTRLLEYSKVKKITDEIHSGAGFESSLLNQLEKEGLIAFVEHKERPLDLPKVYCRFTFDRIADFFIANNVLKSNSEPDQLSLLLSSEWVNKNKGVLEALAIILPELDTPIEITEYGGGSEFHDNLALAFIESLQWRNPDKITYDTKYWVRQFLGESHNTPILLNALIKISMVPNSLLSAFYLDELLKFRDMCIRDSVLTYYLIEDFKQHDSAWTLVDWACNSDVSNYSKESLFLWAITISWFTSCSDRTIRDQSSKGLTRILCADTSNCSLLLAYFISIDDDYILERVSSAIYAALLLVPKNKVTVELATHISKQEYLKHFDNVIVYDNLRLIIELAFVQDETVANKIELKSIRHTFSDTKFIVPDEGRCQELLQSDAFSNLNVNMVGNGGSYTDFQRYVLDGKVDIFDIESAGISMEDIYRWFLVELSNLGYPGQQEACWQFDQYLIGEHGSGRSKPTNTERLGKKYYWILLHRLLGQLRNTVPFKAPQYDGEYEPSHPRLLSLPLRKIDLTDLRYTNNFEYPSLVIPEYNINEETEPVEWTTNNSNLFSIENLISNVSDSNGGHWVPLIHSDSIKKEESKEEYPYKESSVQFSALIIAKKDVSRLKSSIEERGLVSRPFDYITDDYRIFLGEYPFTRPCLEQEETGAWKRSYSICDNIDIQPTTIDMLRGGEWEYDCSFESKSCLFPSRILIQSLNLKWDGYHGWKNNNDELVIFSTKTNKGRAVWIKEDYLSQFIGLDKSLLFVSYNEKMYVKDLMAGANGMHSLRGVYLYDGKAVEELQNKVETCDFRE